MSSRTGFGVQGTWPERCEARAFVEGAKWWEFTKTHGTMWSQDVTEAERIAVERYGDPATDDTAMRDTPLEAAMTVQEQSLVDALNALVDVWRGEAILLRRLHQTAGSGVAVARDRAETLDRCANAIRAVIGSPT